MAPPVESGEAGNVEPPHRRRTLLRILTYRIERSALKRWVEELRKRSGAVDATFETIERDSDIGGGMLAGALSYRLFVFALPLAFFIVSGMGLLASALGVEPHAVVNSSGLSGVVTAQVEKTSKGASSWWVALTSFFVLVYASRVLLRAIAILHSLAWHRTGASVKVSTRSLGVFGALICGQLVLVAGVGAVGHQTTIGGVVTAVVAVLLLAGIWLAISLQVSHADARWTDLIPGSLLYAFGMCGMLAFNVVILGNLLTSKTSTYGALGTAATLLFAFFLLGRVMVLAAVLNATLYERRAR